MSNIKNLDEREYNKENFLSSLESLEEIGLEKFDSIQEKLEDMYAKLEISGEGTKSYYKDDSIGNEGKCKISKIFSDYIIIEGIKTWDEDLRDTASLEMDDTEYLCGNQITLKGISTKQKALVIVLPGTGEGKTTTYFSVHIPIEKRAIQYTPEEIQDKIDRVQAQIEKLDNTIGNLEKLVEGWTKVCLATAALFTIISFFQGMSPSKKSEKDTGETTRDYDETTETNGEPKEKIEGGLIEMTPPEGISNFEELECYYSKDGYKSFLSKLWYI